MTHECPAGSKGASHNIQLAHTDNTFRMKIGKEPTRRSKLPSVLASLASVTELHIEKFFTFVLMSVTLIPGYTVLSLSSPTASISWYSPEMSTGVLSSSFREPGGGEIRVQATFREIIRDLTPFFCLFKGFLPVFLMESNSMCFSEFKNAIKK